MQILLLTPQLPYPPHQGASLRNFQMLRFLARQHTVHLASFLAPDQSADRCGPLTDLCGQMVLLPEPARPAGRRVRDTLTSPLPDMAHRLQTRTMHDAVRRLMAEQAVDLIQIEGIEMAQYGLAARQTAVELGRERPILVLDNHNAEYLLQKRSALIDLGTVGRWPAALYSLIQWRKLIAYEGALCRAVDGVVAVSPADRAALSRLAPGVSSTVIANGLDRERLPDCATPLPEAPVPTLVFTGKMDYRPNIDAMLWFSRQVLPLILDSYPDLRLQVVGRSPHPRLDPLRQHPSIEITGGVPDVLPYIRRAHVYIAPLRVGGGTRFKILEALACARALVSTRLGVEGIPLRHGQEALLADDPQEFAAAVCSLLDAESGSARRAELSRHARRFVAERYAWEEILPELDRFYAGLRTSSG